jgi:hypothetical protein
MKTRFQIGRFQFYRSAHKIKNAANKTNAPQSNPRNDRIRQATMSSSVIFKVILSNIVLAALVATYMMSSGEQHGGTGSLRSESRKLQRQFLGQGPSNAANTAINNILSSNQFIGQGPGTAGANAAIGNILSTNQIIGQAPGTAGANAALNQINTFQGGIIPQNFGSISDGALSAIMLGASSAMP